MITPDKEIIFRTSRKLHSLLVRWTSSFIFLIRTLDMLFQDGDCAVQFCHSLSGPYSIPATSANGHCTASQDSDMRGN